MDGHCDLACSFLPFPVGFCFLQYCSVRVLGQMGASGAATTKILWPVLLIIFCLWAFLWNCKVEPFSSWEGLWRSIRTLNDCIYWFVSEYHTKVTSLTLKVTRCFKPWFLFREISKAANIAIFISFFGARRDFTKAWAWDPWAERAAACYFAKVKRFLGVNLLSSPCSPLEKNCPVEMLLLFQIFNFFICVI